MRTYLTIKSPFDGVVTLRLVTAANLLGLPAALLLDGDIGRLGESRQGFGQADRNKNSPDRFHHELIVTQTSGVFQAPRGGGGVRRDRDA